MTDTMIDDRWARFGIDAEGTRLWQAHGFDADTAAVWRRHRFVRRQGLGTGRFPRR